MVQHESRSFAYDRLMLMLELLQPRLSNMSESVQAKQPNDGNMTSFIAMNTLAVIYLQSFLRSSFHHFKLIVQSPVAERLSHGCNG